LSRTDCWVWQAVGRGSKIAVRAIGKVMEMRS
jgi:hypothetical protein